MSQEPITEPTPFEKAVAMAATVKGNWYFDEYLYRGESNGTNGGQYKGSHVVVGIEYTDQFGDVQRKLFAPMPVGDLPGQVPLSLIFPEAAVALQRAVDSLTARVATLEPQVESLTAQLASANGKLAAVATAIA